MDLQLHFGQSSVCRTVVTLRIAKYVCLNAWVCLFASPVLMNAICVLQLTQSNVVSAECGPIIRNPFSLKVLSLNM